MTTYPIWSGFVGFVWIPISLFPMSCMCLIWLNMHLFYWKFVLIISLSMWAVMTCTLLHFPVGFWLEMASKNCWTVIHYFLPMMRIQILVLFLDRNSCFHGLLFSYWDMYYMLWCSQYCVTMPMVVPLGGKLTLTLNI